MVGNRPRAGRAARTDVNGEQGSLPLALLALIIMTGLVAVVVSSVVAGQRQTRFDERFEDALQTAEIGLDRMTHLVLNHIVTDPDDLAGFGDTLPSGASYTGTAETTDSGGWILDATGVASDGTTRSVRLELEPESLFNLAAFGKFFVDFNGGNAADSYRSGHFEESGFVQSANGSAICDGNSGAPLTDVGSGNSDVLMCNPTGNGVVATNGELDLKGNAWDQADAAEVHHAQDPWVDDPHDGATGTCGMAQWRCEHEKVSYFRDELTLEPDPVEIPSDLTSQGRFPQDFTHEGESNVLPPGTWLFTDVTLDEDTEIQGTPDEPTVVYMTGQLSIPNHHAVNFEWPGGIPRPKPSPGLFILSNSDGGEALSFGNHAAVSAAIYAPNAGFSGGAQGNVYGSLIAGSINNNGGWNFHWDEALADVLDFAPLRPVSWSER